MHLNLSRYSCHIRRARGGGTVRRGEGVGRGRAEVAAGSLELVSLGFYLPGCQIYPPAVNFMFCFFTIFAEQGGYKLHLGESVNTV